MDRNDEEAKQMRALAIQMRQQFLQRREAFRERMLQAKLGEHYDVGESTGRELMIWLLKESEGNPIATKGAAAFFSGVANAINDVLGQHLDHHESN